MVGRVTVLSLALVACNQSDFGDGPSGPEPNPEGPGSPAWGEDNVSCEGDSDCHHGEVCEGGICVPCCQNASDCRAGECCDPLTRQCNTSCGCASDSDCGAGKCCDPVAKACAPCCTASSSCGSGRVCCARP